MSSSKRKGKAVMKGSSSSGPPATVKELTDQFCKTIDAIDLNELPQGLRANLHHHNLIASKVRDQGDYNICWAISTATAAEALYNRDHNLTGDRRLSASPSEIVDNELDLREKVENKPIKKMSRPWLWIKENGIAQQAHYRFGPKPNKKALDPLPGLRIGIHNYELFSEEEDVKEKAILKILAEKPVVVTVTAYKSFKDYVEDGDSVYGGFIASDVVPDLEHHAILLVGYGTVNGIHYFTAMNSWGKRWGNNGFGRIIRSISSNKKTLFHTYSYPV